MKSRKILLAILAAAFVAPAFQSCKKGENDPGLTFSSRKGRVEGVWTVSNSTINNSFTDDDGDTVTQESSYNGSTETVVVTNKDGDVFTTTYTYTEWTITFEKDGNYTETWSRNKTQVEADYADPNITDPDPTVQVDQLDGGIVKTMTKKGTWSFVGADNAAGYKNKERIVINITEETEVEPQQYFDTQTFELKWATETSTETYGNGEYSQVIPITQLKGKEMIFDASFSGSWSYSTTEPDVDNDSYSTSTTISMTLTQD